MSQRSDSTTGGATEDLAAQGREVAGEIQDQAGRLVDLAREQMSTRLASQKERAAGGVDTVALVLQQVAQQFRQQDQGTVAEYVDSAANQVEELANTLREQDLSQLVTTVGRYARRQPAPFLAATFALGFLGTRFFKSSTSQQEEQTTGSVGYGYPAAADWPDRYASGIPGPGYTPAATEGGLGYGSSSLPTYGGAPDDLGSPATDISGTGMAGTGLTGTTGTRLDGDQTSSADRDAGAEGR